MNAAFTFALPLFTLSALAANPTTYKVDTEYTHGNETTKKTMLVEKGGEFSTNQCSVKFTLLPKQKDVVAVNYQIREKGKLLAAPAVMVQLGKEASFSDQVEGGLKRTVKVKVEEWKGAPSEHLDLGKEFASMPMSDQDLLEDLEMSEPPARN